VRIVELSRRQRSAPLSQVEGPADDQNNLEFTLRMQEYIELCRQRKVPEAIVYSRKNLAPWAATHLVELQQAMTLLAFGEKSGVALYRVSL